MKNGLGKNGFFMILVITTIILVGCTTTIPVSSNINDFVMMGLRTNRQDNVSVEIISNIQDGEIIVMNQAGTGQTGKVIIHQGTVLRKMVDDYMVAKFSRISDSGDVQITVTLRDFSVQDYNTESGGMQVLRGLAGGSTAAREPRMVSARITATIDIVGAEINETRNFVASSEENYIGQFTSENGNRAFANVVNGANNRLLMQMGAFFEEIGM